MFFKVFHKQIDCYEYKIICYLQILQVLYVSKHDFHKNVLGWHKFKI